MLTRSTNLRGCQKVMQLQDAVHNGRLHQFMNDDDEILIECSYCHDLFDLEQMRMNENGKSVSCDKCRSEPSFSSIVEPPTDNWKTQERNLHGRPI